MCSHTHTHAHNSPTEWNWWGDQWPIPVHDSGDWWFTRCSVELINQGVVRITGTLLEFYFSLEVSSVKCINNQGFILFPSVWLINGVFFLSSHVEQWHHQLWRTTLTTGVCVCYKLPFPNLIYLPFNHGAFHEPGSLEIWRKMLRGMQLNVECPTSEEEATRITLTWVKN